MKKTEQHIKHLPRNQFAEIYGWLGSMLILSGYALLTLGLINGNSPMYHLMFLIGSLGLAIVTYRHRAYQSFIVNVFFSLLALVAIIRILYFT